MFFRFKASFSVAFNFGPAESGGFRRDMQGENRRNTNTPSPVSQRYPQPQHASRIQPQTPPNPSRPKLHRFGRFQRVSAPMMANDPGAETDLAKAKDRESLKHILRVSSHTGRSTRATGGDGAASSRTTGYSLVQHVPAASSSVTLEDPFVSNSPLNLPSDSGSDLVSSLQRLRVRVLASYFEEIERTAHPSHSSTTLIRGDVEREAFDSSGKEDDETKVVTLEDWEEITMSDLD